MLSIFPKKTAEAILARLEIAYRVGWKIIIGSKGLFCDLEGTRRVGRAREHPAGRIETKIDTHTFCPREIAPLIKMDLIDALI